MSDQIAPAAGDGIGTGPDTPPEPVPTRPPAVPTWMVMFLVVALVGALALVSIGLSRASSSVSALQEEVELLRETVEATGSAVVRIDQSIADVATDLDSVGAEVDDVSRRLAAAEALDAPSGASSSSDAPPQPADIRSNGLLGEISGTEYYSGARVSFSPDDEKARVYLVFAHWCPYCQNDLEVLDDWYPANKARFPNTELVAVSTFRDDGRGDHDALLDGLSIGAPIIVDPDHSLAAQLGNQGSVPYWVFVGSGGEVIGQHSGLLHLEQIESVFQQMEAAASGA